MQMQFAIIIGFGFLVAGVLFIGLSLSWFSRDDMSQRMKSYVGEDVGARQLETSLLARSMELRGTFSERTVLPFLRQVSGVAGNLLPVRRVAALDRKLMIAGNPMGLRAKEFYGLQMAFGILGFIISLLVYIQGVQNVYLIGLIIMVLSLLFPVIWLNRRVRQRQNQIRKELPDVIDMLSVCTSAGLSFDQSLQRVSEEWRTQLSWELSRVVSEMEMGLTRIEALRNLSDRIDISELSSFVSIIIQSDKLGMSISDTLHALAGQMRIEWRFRAQEEARKIPVKILLPLVFLVFPAMLAVILGPSIPALLEMFETI